MSQRLLLLLSLFAVALPAAANQTVRTYFAYDEFATDETKWTPGDTDGVITSTGDVKPTNYMFQFSSGQQNVFTVHPANGWEIAAWYCAPHGSGYKKWQVQSGGNTFTWKADAQKDHTGWESLDLIAAFKPIDYTINFKDGTSALMDPLRDVCYTNVFNLPACPPRTGYAFAHWVNDLTHGTLSNQESVSGDKLGVTNDKRDVTLAVEWQEKTYGITSAAANGSVTVKASALYTEDVTVTWAPKSQEGHSFSLESVTVYGGTSAAGTVLRSFSSGTSGSFRMSDIGKGYFSNVFVEVVYSDSPVQHRVDVASGGNGVVTKSPSQFEYDYGTSVTITATADDGYAFQKWNDGATDNPRTVNVGAADVTYTAYFTNRLYTLSFDAHGGTCPETSRTIAFKAYIGNLPEASQHLKSLRGWYTAAAGGTQITGVDRYTWATDVTLHAQWDDAEAIVIDVIADPPQGGTVSGGGNQFEKGDRTTLTATPNAGYSFVSWSDGGAQTHAVEVVGNAEYTATFLGKVYDVYFDPRSGSAVEESRPYRYGERFGSLPTTQRDGYLFDGWFTRRTGGERVTEETVFDFADPDTEEYTLYAQWTERPSYSVAFVGGEKAEGEMPDQTIYRGAPTALASNAFVRAGYTFGGWAEAGDLAKVKYADGQVVTDIAAAGETKELHAVWSTNRYTVAFDGNGATEVAMDPQPFVYDVEQDLRPNTFARGELWSFAGWSNTVDGTVFGDGALVSNLCATADGTNTLKAVWRSNLTDLSRAMHCDNLIWVNGWPNASSESWKGCAGEGLGYGSSGSEVRAAVGFVLGAGYQTLSSLAATGTVSGTLSFMWKASGGATKLDLYLDPDGVRDREPHATKGIDVFGSWQPCEWTVELPAGKTFQVMRIMLVGESEDAAISIDQMTWTPGGGEPQQGDPVAPTAAGVEGNAFSLTIPTTSGISYGVWTNADLTVPQTDWGLWETKSGDGQPWTPAWTILPETPQLFFRAFKLK